MTRAFLFFGFIAAVLFSSCSPRIPERRNVPPAAKKISTATIVAKQFLPEGWADITSRSKQPQIKLWIVNKDFSATMILRELQIDSSTQKTLFNEEMNLIATISLRGKVPDNDPDYRVTRVPSLIDVKRNFSSYTFSEKGLLRRVIVFKKQRSLMELELLQEQLNAEFDDLTNDLVTFATTLSER